MQVAQPRSELLAVFSFMRPKARMLRNHAVTRLREEQSSGATQVSMSFAVDLKS